MNATTEIHMMTETDRMILLRSIYGAVRDNAGISTEEIGALTMPGRDETFIIVAVTLAAKLGGLRGKWAGGKRRWRTPLQ